MPAKARSRDRQGKAEDRARRAPKPNKARSPLCDRIRLAMEMMSAYPMDD